MKALIDGDMVIFKAGMANEKRCYKIRLPDGTVKDLGNSLTKTQIKKEHPEAEVAGYKLVNPARFCFQTAKIIINKILEGSGCDSYTIYLADPAVKNFRYAIAKTLPYKANRDPKQRPTHEAAIRDYLLKNHPCKVVTGIEVDDALGIDQIDSLNYSENLINAVGFSWQKLENVAATCICTSDKDLDMIPGWHFDPEVGGASGRKTYKRNAKYFVTDPGAISLRKTTAGRSQLVGCGQLWFCTQMLLGDSTDNIPGFSGVGPVAAFSVLEGVKTYPEAVRRVYSFYRKTLADTHTKEQIDARFFEVAQLCWIRREEKGKIFPKQWLEEIEDVQ